MKKFTLIFFTLTFITFASKAQIRFEPGYYIDNNGERKTCLIKDIGWTNNPEKFTYLLADDGTVLTKDITSVQEFGIGKRLIFKRFIVEIDKSTNRLNALSLNQRPEFETDTLLLRELVKGEISLYSFQDGDISRYFYKNPSTKITQLIYKKYSKNGSLATNKQYLTQLFIDVNCGNLTAAKIERVRYIQKDLVNYFIEHNKCSGGDYFSSYDPADAVVKDNSLRLNLRAGVNDASFVLDYLPGNLFDGDFGSQLTARIGVEMEVSIPATKNKWSFIIEPYYTTFKSSIILPNVTQPTMDEAEIDLTSIELSAGLRYYFHLTEKSKIYANLGFSIGITGNSQITIERVNDFPIRSGLRGNVGIGYNYNDRFYLEFKQNSAPSLINRFLDWNSQYKSRAIILGFTILK